MSDDVKGVLRGVLTTMGLNCDPVDWYSAGKGFCPEQKVEVQIPDLKTLLCIRHTLQNTGDDKQ